MPQLTFGIEYQAFTAEELWASGAGGRNNQIVDMITPDPALPRSSNHFHNYNYHLPSASSEWRTGTMQVYYEGGQVTEVLIRSQVPRPNRSTHVQVDLRLPVIRSLRFTYLGVQFLLEPRQIGEHSFARLMAQLQEFTRPEVRTAEIRRLAALPPAELDAALRFGFELETQATDGVTASGRDGTRQLDRAAYEAAIASYTSEYQRTPALWWDYLPLGLRPTVGTTAYNLSDFQEYLRWIAAARITEVSGLDILQLSSAHRALLHTGLEAAARERVREEDYVVVRDYDWFSGQHAAALAPLHLEVGTDGSVRGFEFRTLGGRTAEEFRAAAAHLFTAHTHAIDTQCSFHLHASVEGLGSEWTRRTQAALIEYLARNIERVPARVQDRWRSGQMQRYFRLQLEREKYSFVHCHPLGTWEFRCFGNINSLEEALVCRELVAEAMQFALRVQSSDTEVLLFNGANYTEWVRHLHASITTGTPLPPIGFTRDRLAELLSETSAPRMPPPPEEDYPEDEEDYPEDEQEEDVEDADQGLEPLEA